MQLPHLSLALSLSLSFSLPHSLSLSLSFLHCAEGWRVNELPQMQLEVLTAESRRFNTDPN